MNLKRFSRKLKAFQYVVNGNAKVSFSQVGEDLIVNYLFSKLNISKPSYLDIGTNHPITGSNTYFFYNQGCKGVCVEPDPALFKLIKSIRRRDIVINAGVGVNNDSIGRLYIFPGQYTGWNTFSKEEARIREEETGIKVISEVKVPFISIDSILQNYFVTPPNFLSIDIEGLDLAVLKSIDFQTFKPEVICVESITFSIDNSEQKITDIINFVESKGYLVYADSHVNTIFCRSDLLKKQ